MAGSPRTAQLDRVSELERSRDAALATEGALSCGRPSPAASRSLIAASVRPVSWSNWRQRALRAAPADRRASEAEVVGALRAAERADLCVRVAGSGTRSRRSSPLTACCSRSTASPASHGTSPSAGASGARGTTLRALGLRCTRSVSRSRTSATSTCRRSAARSHRHARHGAQRSPIFRTRVRLRLLLADGSLQVLPAEDEPERLAAARVSLGALGVVTAARLDCVPAYRLHERVERMPIDACLASLDEAARPAATSNSSGTRAATWRDQDAPADDAAPRAAAGKKYEGSAGATRSCPRTHAAFRRDGVRPAAAAGRLASAPCASGCGAGTPRCLAGRSTAACAATPLALHCPRTRDGHALAPPGAELPWQDFFAISNPCYERTADARTGGSAQPRRTGGSPRSIRTSPRSAAAGRSRPERALPERTPARPVRRLTRVGADLVSWAAWFDRVRLGLPQPEA